MTIIERLDQPSRYVERNLRRQGHMEDLDKLAQSKTIYVGNLSFFTTEAQIRQLFALAGRVQQVIMGLDRFEKTPCGFCFVEYSTRDGALDCLKYISGTKLDDRIIRADMDLGFVPGREFGRGRSGGQMRDEARLEYDQARGGFGRRDDREKEREAEE